MRQGFHCKACGWEEPQAEERKHCPNCLCAIHEAADGEDEADACGGVLEPVSIWVRSQTQWEVIGRCRRCGEMHATPVAKADNPIVLLSIASKPLAMPPFPLEKLEQLTDLMGGQGTIGGYYHES